MPPCPYARVAGENGLRLVRAAFAATLKLSDKGENFRSLQEEVTEATAELSDEHTGTQKLRKILDHLHQKGSKELQPMMDRWEQASELRRWLNDKKSSMSDDLIKEAKENFIKEVNLSDPSLEGKFEGPLSPEQEELVESRSFALLEEKIASIVNDLIEKARFMLKMRVPDEF